MDRYDNAIDFLTFSPRRFTARVREAWNFPEQVRGGSLFLRASKTGESDYMTPENCIGCGCLTQVRAGTKVAQTDVLTQLIRADERIPTDWEEITPESLQAFAEWQRKLDEAYPERLELLTEDSQN